MNEEEKSVDQRIADLEQYVSGSQPPASPAPPETVGGIIVHVSTLSFHLPYLGLGLAIPALLVSLVVGFLVARKCGRF